MMTSRTIHLPNSQNSLKTALFETNTVYRRYWLQSLHCLFIPNLSPFVTLIGEKGVFPKMLIQHNMKVAKKKPSACSGSCSIAGLVGSIQPQLSHINLQHRKDSRSTPTYRHQFQQAEVALIPLLEHFACTFCSGRQQGKAVRYQGNHRSSQTTRSYNKSLKTSLHPLAVVTFLIFSFHS